MNDTYYLDSKNIRHFLSTSDLQQIESGNCIDVRQSDWVAATQDDIDAWALAAQPIPPTYQELRAAEYPPMSDYLDAVVKGDTAQQQAYIDACLSIKAKYPKP